MSEKKINILVAPLNWGLGHAARCVPLIKLLQEKGFHVILASDGHALTFLQKAFPHLECINLNGYNIAYPGSGKNMFLRMFLQIPRILRAIRKEHRQLKNIVKAREISIVLSDNRYGLWNRDTYNIFMTHQLMLKMPGRLRFLEPLVHRLILIMIRRFDEVWVPDYAGTPNLSGDLSHKFSISPKISFIGPLSRFNPAMKGTTTESCDILFLISGPEPQRSLFENIILSAVKGTDLSIVILRGLPGNEERPQADARIKIYAHLPSEKIQQLLNAAKTVVARSGYSSIMDFTALRKQAVLVPTPGQTEQEYLAVHLGKTGLFASIAQEQLSLENIRNLSPSSIPALPDFDQEKLLHEKLSIIAEILKKKQKFA